MALKAGKGWRMFLMTRVEFVKLISLHNARTTQNATVAVSSEVNAL